MRSGAWYAASPPVYTGITDHFGQAKSAKDLVALLDAMMVPTSREENARSPHRSFKIKPDFGTLRIGICEPTIWKAWRKSGRINGDAERFMVSWWLSAYFVAWKSIGEHTCAASRLHRFRSCRHRSADIMQTQKYDMVVQSMIEMGVDIVYPVELPNQSSLTIDGRNCFEPVVCRHSQQTDTIQHSMLIRTRLGVQRLPDRIHPGFQSN